jgi:hypothetical protein
MDKLTRRQVAAAIAATAPLAAQEAPPQPATPADELKAAAERLRRTTGTLAKFEVPMAAEPAFSFKA